MDAVDLPVGAPVFRPQKMNLSRARFSALQRMMPDTKMRVPIDPPEVPDGDPNQFFGKVCREIGGLPGQSAAEIVLRPGSSDFLAWRGMTTPCFFVVPALSNHEMNFFEAGRPLNLIFRTLPAEEQLGFVRELYDRGHRLHWEYRTQTESVSRIDELQRALARHGVVFPGGRGVGLLSPDLDTDLNLDPCDFETREFGGVGCPQISVISPNGGRGHRLPQLLRGLQRQSLPPSEFELLVINDGEEALDDLTFAVEQARPEFSTRVVHYRKGPGHPRSVPAERRGQCRNLGGCLARGRYVFFLDSDAFPPPALLAEFLELVRTGTLVQFRRTHVPEPAWREVPPIFCGKDELFSLREPGYLREFYGTTPWMELEFFWKFTCSFALGLSRAEFLAMGMFRRDFVSYGFEDVEFGYRWAQNGLSFVRGNAIVQHLDGRFETGDPVRHQLNRQEALAHTAKVFYRSQPAPELFRHFAIYMGAGPEEVSRRNE